MTVYDLLKSMILVSVKMRIQLPKTHKNINFIHYVTLLMLNTH